MLNVIAGGTLHMDLSSFRGLRPDPDRLGALDCPQVGQAAQALQARRDRRRCDLRVNIIHQQAIDRVGAGLKVAAREPNCVIQAVEDPSRPFWIGVQYHPELMIHRAVHRRLFKALVAAAKARRSGSVSQDP